ncbi:MAG: hypothetical protein R3B82_01915 [Sandaracinaceae bacterium]
MPAEAFEKQIDEFGDKLVEFVRAANEETTRSIAEVVRAACHALRGVRGARGISLRRSAARSAASRS